MCVGEAHRLTNSAYNFFVPIGENALLYNTNTGAVLRFQGRDAHDLAKLLSGRPVEVQDDVLEAETYSQLRAGGFIVSAEHDELSEIRARYQQARRGTPIVLTLTTTMDCNLGCYYCYEERSNARLGLKDVDALVVLAKERLTRSGKRSLHVDWYGGEPLMNLEFMESASLALQALCQRLDCSYAASAISNGTCWPEDVSEFIGRHKIRQVQISFDGLRENHNRRRRYRKQYADSDNPSSFDTAVQLVDRLLDHVRVDLRINIDRANRDDVIPFIDVARSRGWFKRRFPAIIQPARLASYSERSLFMRKSELPIHEYDEIRGLVRAAVGSGAAVEESESPNGFPYPRTSVCAALAYDSAVIGADGREYRCGLQVSEPLRAVGGIRVQGNSALPADQSDASWWHDFDPTTLPSCSRCSFLPICWAGCPKKHLEGDTHAIAEQGFYWRKNLPRLVASRVGAEVSPDFSFTEADQFRMD